jgi:nucleoside-diphosphate-sugar epimerase
VGLLGNNHALGETFHITSDEILTWNQIFELVANAAGTEAKLIHIPSDFIAHFDANWGDGLLGDKMHSMIFDNSKIKRVVPEYVAAIPFAQGIKEVMAWYDEDPARQTINTEFDERIDKIIQAYESAWTQ